MSADHHINLPPMTPERVLEFKAEAKALKQADNLKHHEALKRVAWREGFDSWDLLVERAGGGEAMRDEKADRPPSEARIARNERKAERIRRYAPELQGQRR